ncbi:TRAP transporter small permease subunit [Aureimonas sp. OT7]|uniref:TRAP transporter small permease subunit n=1 Tax=Aureimonas sp. OT7 TaxID=2816454 RepID=UPI0017845022|nr:TRAP transporter small permease subunit [Aureimonas sp. OT7]QOG07237.1 TRAP transporter small permease subunit [Aureimonas sp. OT7]
MSDSVALAAPRGALRRNALMVVEIAAIALLVALVVLVLANSLGRYLFARPLPWSEEIVRSLLMWLGGLGITVAALRNDMRTPRWRRCPWSTWPSSQPSS